ncbi:endogenous retrovirus group K member 8 Gag polyprotein-like [Trichosurus vulpecula]|uniref:endogenous retrovirus group K member 8 Gag polyprotein-like n=1 Tax=Trichosurus vulpecula TaxID=9337 RepID=UPI00186B272E|nr:endogenous retrovirus group K member 8 Gag polyprotein-like [Trichosurus vulpecula]
MEQAASVGGHLAPNVEARTLDSDPIDAPAPTRPDSENPLKVSVRVYRHHGITTIQRTDKVCPWFIVNGPDIHPGKWQKVGRDLNERLKQEGPESVPINAFSLWSLINDIIEGSTGDKGARQLLVQAESCLTPLSRAASASSLHAENSQDKEEVKSPPPTPTAKSIYPPLPNPVEETLTFPVFPTERKVGMNTAPENESGPLPDENAANLDVEAAAYNPQEVFVSHTFSPPPYLLPPLVDLTQIQRDLTQRMAELRKTVNMQNQYHQMVKEFSALQASLQKALLPPSAPKGTVIALPQDKIPQPKQKQKSLLFPILRSNTQNRPKDAEDTNSDKHPPENSAGLEESEEESQEEEVEDDDRESDSEEDSKSCSSKYKAPKFKNIKDLHAAVKKYGPNAPFTLSALEAIGQGGYLLPGEWVRVAQAALSRGQFLTWKAEFEYHCQTIEKRNLKSKANRDWTFEKLAGRGEYALEKKQRKLPTGLLEQTAHAANRAWRALPVTGSPFTPLNKITQRKDEEYSDFVSRLLETAERTLGNEASDDLIIKRLAFENANGPCRSVLNGQWQDKTLNEMIKLCRDIQDPTAAKIEKMSQAVLALQNPMKNMSEAFLTIGAAVDNTVKTCFKCGAEGHFARQCPMNQPNPTAQKRRAAPATPCPRCRKGFHWGNTCRATHDIEGKPLPPLSGNGWRGPPRTPQGLAQPATGTHPAHSSPEQRQAVQEWTCVPPPPQY